MKYLNKALLLTLFTCSVILSVSLSPLYSLNKLADNARKYVGTVETGENRGSLIDLFNKSVGNPLGSPYCAAFGYFNKIECGFVNPNIKSGLATKWITKKSIRAKDVAKGYVKLDSNKSYFVIWQKGNTIFGHLAILVKQKGISLITIEANTSSGNIGNQSDGDGIFIRNRKIMYDTYFRIVYFTEIY